MSPRNEMLKLTANHSTNEVVFRSETREDWARKVCGRSAYLCKSQTCLDQALKGTRLRNALEGRRTKDAPPPRRVAWPLESQLIHTMRSKCTEILETCQNTHIEEGADGRS
ncbi:MAG: DUF448 domain-containing protein [Candidatus Obscuribacterales bacterium]|nr:DUF448 domain-containing protein [Candidatus Obscuribacterales bacterium]